MTLVQREKQIITILIAVFFSIIASNLDRLIKYYKKKVNWFRPEFDLEAGDTFDVVTSSNEKDDAELSKSASNTYVKEDKIVIDDMEPVLVVLRDRNLRVQHHLSNALPVLRRDENIISFGGEVGNEFTCFVLEKLDCPLRFKKYAIIDKKDHNRKYTSKWDKYGRIVLDYALIVKTPNPLRIQQLDKIVYIFAGIHKPGTFGAACFTRDRYADMINEVVKGMKAFAVLAEIQVNYLGMESSDPTITPKSVVRVYDLSYKHVSVHY